MDSLKHLFSQNLQTFEIKFPVQAILHQCGLSISMTLLGHPKAKDCYGPVKTHLLGIVHLLGLQ